MPRRARHRAAFDKAAARLPVRRIAERENARVIVQHAPEDVARMPAFPAWLD